MNAENKELAIKDLNALKEKINERMADRQSEWAIDNFLNQTGEAWSNSNTPGENVYFTPHKRPDEEARLFDAPLDIKIGVSADVIARYDMDRGGYVFVSEVED